MCDCLLGPGVYINFNAAIELTQQIPKLTRGSKKSIEEKDKEEMKRVVKVKERLGHLTCRQIVRLVRI